MTISILMNKMCYIDENLLYTFKNKYSLGENAKIVTQPPIDYIYVQEPDGNMFLEVLDFGGYDLHAFNVLFSFYTEIQAQKIDITKISSFDSVSKLALQTILKDPQITDWMCYNNADLESKKGENAIIIFNYLWDFNKKLLIFLQHEYPKIESYKINQISTFLDLDRSIQKLYLRYLLTAYTSVMACHIANLPPDDMFMYQYFYADLSEEKIEQLRAQLSVLGE